ncbi:AGL322Wp [Eremothecium gossypii ATCC 10895]|uniref:AGL322Wp n=1 Tax=Eremothecium gossypii (strain ATCC 10895 / CBS 109.51 / FGSC 9923 / NRRL Y-1056) TaxID=284811 RepID=Q751L9_EREGS|nr:AGL322Wp [Eremothecium gossypii ATCC 10895]AAS54169.1 AGL322Wp [Eremothecium gossypii ATCC 10895]AEY98495.1 FAGL322Wp [Eremothecium gossypii FDAG1]
MGFFYENPLFDFFHRAVRRPASIAMWLFTGLVVASALASILALPAPRRPKRPDGAGP